MEHQPTPGLGDDFPPRWGTFYPIGPGFGPRNFDEEMLLNWEANPDRVAGNPHGPLALEEPPVTEPEPQPHASATPETEDSKQPLAA